MLCSMRRLRIVVQLGPEAVPCWRRLFTGTVQRWCSCNPTASCRQWTKITLNLTLRNVGLRTVRLLSLFCRASPGSDASLTEVPSSWAVVLTVDVNCKVTPLITQTRSGCADDAHERNGGRTVYLLITSGGNDRKQTLSIRCSVGVRSRHGWRTPTMQQNGWTRSVNKFCSVWVVKVSQWV